MQELQVPMRRIEVEAFAADGEHMSGFLFLAESPYQSGGPEDLLDALNDERSFLPFRSDDESAGTSILNKAQIVRVAVRTDGETAVESTGGETDCIDQEGGQCTLLLADGIRVQGKIVLETPQSSSRLVDKLNFGERFLLVSSVNSVNFVHKDHIVRAY